EIAYNLVKFMIENYRTNLCEKYKIENTFIEETLSRDLPENENIYEIMQEIGKKRGCLVTGGKVDDEKTSKIILDEFKNGKLGKITIERA
ncbi:MAG: ribosome biogenesis GTPase YlqF, partial [Clostridia bacterium]|nr:ribosome biogenesis GTPase YlqF [Clostridia bacterium]